MKRLFCLGSFIFLNLYAEEAKTKKNLKTESPAPTKNVSEQNSGQKDFKEFFPTFTKS